MMILMPVLQPSNTTVWVSPLGVKHAPPGYVMDVVYNFQTTFCGLRKTRDVSHENIAKTSQIKAQQAEIHRLTVENAKLKGKRKATDSSDSDSASVSDSDLESSNGSDEEE
jgi:hypothetical protein